MATIRFPPDFKDFLKLLSSHKVRYLLVGGYAVGYYGYPRATGDMDVWIAMDPENAKKMVKVVRAFGFNVPELSIELFLESGKVVRMGVPPLRLEILNSISGVDFTQCYAKRKVELIDEIEVNFISLQDLKINKKKAGRYKDLDDLENLP